MEKHSLLKKLAPPLLGLYICGWLGLLVVGGVIAVNLFRKPFGDPSDTNSYLLANLFPDYVKDELSDKGAYFERVSSGSSRNSRGDDSILGFGLFSKESMAVPTSATSTSGRVSSSADDSYYELGSGENIIDPATLSGGEIDDNEHFSDFISYVASQSHPELSDILLSDRYEIVVKDASGKAVLGQELIINGSNGVTYKLITDADGKIYFFPALYTNVGQQGGGDLASSYSIAIGDKSYSFSANELLWDITLTNKTDNLTDLTLDLVFVIDTTGSMSDQIDRLKETMGSISQKISILENAPKIRYGMVIYRDVTDEYVTRVYDFTENLAEFQANLASIVASGGGDYPEDVNSALKDTMEQLSWSTNKNAVRVAFLVADAPPHNDYGQDYDYRIAALRGAELGVKIYPVASSGLDNTEGELIYRTTALLTNARYVFITNASGGTDYHVSEDKYTVSALDQLIVDIISEELALIE